MNYQSIFERVEAKYLITRKQYAQLMTVMKDHLRADVYPHSDIRSIYFDSSDYRLIRTSLNKPAYKEKLRLRSYGDPELSNQVFFEIKKKYHGICYKRRQDMNYQAALDYLVFDKIPCQSQIMKEIEFMRNHDDQLQPKVMISYQRDSFIGKNDDSLRITFDYHVRFSTRNITLTNQKPEGQLLDDDLLIMEIKTLQAMPLWLSNALDSLKIYPSNFSKYAAVYQQYLMKGVNRKCSNYYSHQSSPIRLPLPTTYYAH